MARTSSTTPLQKALKSLETVLSSEFEATQAILRQGDRLVIPEFMSWRQASDALLRHEKLMDETSALTWEWDAHPHDVMANFYRAVTEQFGALMGMQVNTWFGTKPAQSWDVPIGYGETINVPVGEAQVPGLPMYFTVNPYLDPANENGGQIAIRVTYKRLYQPLVDRIKKAIDQKLKKESIFMGKAIDSKWQFLNTAGFDADRVVYSAREFRQLQANLFTPISRTKEWVKSGSPIKRGVLLYGPYGTGKTLTAMMTAKICEENKWTFMNVLPGDDIVKSIKFAKRYPPCVVFLEDIDAETSGNERNPRLNEILNTIDGLVSKDAKVISVLTTNHVDAIHRSMLRPGRLDAIINLGALDEEGVVNMIRATARDENRNSLLETQELDGPVLYEAAKEYVPAFVVEAVTKAKSYALARNINGEKLLLSQEDLVEALHELRPQWELMQSVQRVTIPRLDQAFSSIINGSLQEVVDKLEYLENRL